MCEDCDNRIQAIMDVPEPVDAKWTCPKCGPQEIHKDRATPTFSAGGFWAAVGESLWLIAIVVAVAACAIVRTLYGK